jgi:Uma2 family endonuclease
MPVQAVNTAQRMSVREFRAFQEDRPDHERWELIRGVPVMMVPPLIVHNVIGDNFSRLLNGAMAEKDIERIAIQRSGLTLQNIGDDYQPEPDLMVIDADFAADQRFVDRAYLLAEIVSSTDRRRVPGTGEAWIDIKRRFYLAHEACEAVLIVEQDRVEVRIDLRTESGWVSDKLTSGSDALILPSFGLHCRIEQLYAGTPGHRNRPGRS